MELINILYVNDGISLGGADSKKHNIENAFKNIRFTAVCSNLEATDKLTTNHYDFIFYDIGMDKRETYPVAHSFKELKPGAVLIGMSFCMNYRLLNLPEFFDG